MVAPHHSHWRRANAWNVSFRYFSMRYITMTNSLFDNPVFDCNVAMRRTPVWGTKRGFVLIRSSSLGPNTECPIPSGESRLRAPDLQAWPSSLQKSNPYLHGGSPDFAFHLTHPSVFENPSVLFHHLSRLTPIDDDFHQLRENNNVSMWGLRLTKI